MCKNHTSNHVKCGQQLLGLTPGVNHVKCGQQLLGLTPWENHSLKTSPAFILIKIAIAVIQRLRENKHIVLKHKKTT